MVWSDQQNSKRGARANTMPGLCGILYPDVYQMGQVLPRMMLTLASRSGLVTDDYTYKNLNIGCTSTQFHHDTRTATRTAIDGTIYHLDTLRKKLRNKGRDITGDASQERLILQAYAVWGVDFLEHIDGDFVLIILDQSREELIIARDRIGRKPLYWFQHTNQFLFASELKALLATGMIPATPSMEAIATYLFFGYMPQDATPIEGINKLLPAHYIRLHFNQNKSIHSYWSYHSYFNKDGTYHRADEEQRVEALLKDSVHTRVSSGSTKKDKIGCLVSGGLGSASIAHYLQCEHPNSDGYTVGFRGDNDTDMQTAETVAETVGIVSHSQLITEDNLFTDLPRIIWHLDEPIADPYIVATWRLSQLAANKVNVVFSGVGSDEVLAGHTRFLKPELPPTFSQKLDQMLKPIIKLLFLKPLTLVAPRTALRFLKHYPTDPQQAQYLADNALMDPQMMHLAAPSLSRLFDPETFLHRFYSIDEIGTSADVTMYLDVKTRLSDLYIHQYDRLTAAHGLTWHTPFLDRRLIEFVASLPRGGYRKEGGGSLLKHLMRPIYPSSVVERPKIKRPAFLKSWAQHPKIFDIFSALSHGTLVGNGIISRGWIHQLLELNNNRPAHINPFRYLWAVLCLELWFRLYIDNPATTAPPTATVEEILKV
ncbi:Uncharacterized protein SCG7086_AS_00200 [Chlamydiales bacterium SCGC AG-110-P3]|nr:Uncharacterized protein SCG7086_AS_00200 [Chlamydiales bacterium SCGC AG-110-P3]